MKKEYNCIKCNNVIEIIDYLSEVNPEKCMWSGGVVSRIEAGYGSTLDGNVYFIGICDNCLKELQDSKKIIFVKNYLFSDIKKQ